jgi:hypothetical protein
MITAAKSVHTNNGNSCAGLRSSNELYPVVVAIALLAGLAVPTFGVFKGWISIIQVCAAVAAVSCVWRFPVSAIAIYLFGYQVPFYLTVGHALIPYAGGVLSTGILLALLSPMRRHFELPRAAQQILLPLGCLCLLSVASSFWGTDWISLDAILGFAFALGSFWIFNKERDWWVAIGWLGLAETMVSLGLFIYKKSEVQSEDFLHAKGEMTGDANYASFFIGLAITTAWCIAIRGWGYLKRSPHQYVAAGLRVLATLMVAAGAYVLVHFQSRGLTAAVVGALAASVLHLRRDFKQFLVGGVLAIVVLALISQTSPFESLMQRWSDKSELRDGNSRVQIWQWVFDQWQTGPLFNKVFGFGCAAEVEKAGAYFGGSAKMSEVSTHNTFLRFMLDQGAVGIGLFVWVLFCCLRCSWRGSNDLANIRFTLLVFLILAGLSIEPQREPVFWICLALCIPIERVEWSCAAVPAHLRSSSITKRTPKPGASVASSPTQTRLSRRRRSLRSPIRRVLRRAVVSR